MLLMTTHFHPLVAACPLLQVDSTSEAEVLTTYLGVHRLSLSQLLLEHVLRSNQAPGNLRVGHALTLQILEQLDALVAEDQSLLQRLASAELVPNCSGKLMRAGL